MKASQATRAAELIALHKAISELWAVCQPGQFYSGFLGGGTPSAIEPMVLGLIKTDLKDVGKTLISARWPLMIEWEVARPMLRCALDTIAAEQNYREALIRLGVEL